MDSLRVLDGFTGTAGLRRQHLRRPLSQSLRCRSSVGKAVCRNSSSDLWERVQEAWKVLLGSSPSSRPGRRRVKQRFSRVLVADRGFDTQRLTQLYELAKEAIEQDVVLEQGSVQEIARVDNCGELTLEFNVRRIKSSAQEEL